MISYSILCVKKKFLFKIKEIQKEKIMSINLPNNAWRKLCLGDNNISNPLTRK
jgi:hypothetical protein